MSDTRCKDVNVEFDGVLFRASGASCHSRLFDDGSYLWVICGGEEELKEEGERVKGGEREREGERDGRKEGEQSDGVREGKERVGERETNNHPFTFKFRSVQLLIQLHTSLQHGQL